MAVRSRLICGIVFCLLTSSGCGVSAAAGTSPRHSAGNRSLWKSCGPNSLDMFLKSYGRSVDYVQVSRTLTIGPDGASMLALANAAEQHGMPSEIRHCTFDSLRRCPLPFIAHFMWEHASSGAASGHYVLVVSVDEDGVTYIDGTTAETVRYSRKLFTGRWSGHVLIRRTPSAQGLLWIYLVVAVLGVSLGVSMVLGCWKRDRRRHRKAAVVGAVAIVTGLACPLAPLDAAEVHDESQDATVIWRTTTNDGLNSLYVLLRYYGCAVKHSELDSMFRRNERPTSLNKLKDIAQQVGLPTEVYRWRPEDFADFGQPVIAHVEQSQDSAQFVVVKDRGGPNYLLINGGSATIMEMPADQFRRAWSGYVLVPRPSAVPRLVSILMGSAIVTGYALWRWPRRPSSPVVLADADS